MSEAISGALVTFVPGYRFAHPGYDISDAAAMIGAPAWDSPAEIAMIEASSFCFNPAKSTFQALTPPSSWR
jgi:hypothetical protein